MAAATVASPRRRRLSVAIIGDAFADLFCFLDGDLPKSGGDSRLLQPIQTMAGGSGLNTATHLSSFVRHDDQPSEEGESAAPVPEVERIETSCSLHTVLNDSDDYGRLLRSHAEKHAFELVNCHRPADGETSSITTTTGDSNSDSTGHCAVIVSNGERSFMTHLGVVSKFQAHHVSVDRILRGLNNDIGGNDTADDHAHHNLHVHVAGYYNIAGFFNGKLKTLLETIRSRRETIDPEAKPSDNIIQQQTTISLVPQHDASEQWDGGLLDLLPLVDYLILSELEAESIAKLGQNNDLSTLATFFHEKSPTTHVVVTLGAKGAVVLKDGKIAENQDAPIAIDDPVDPTGAGDSFVAGFLHGIHRRCHRHYRSEAGDNSEVLRRGLFYGCVLGTSCVMRRGASVPASKAEIDDLITTSRSMRS